jgi:hypothetical protein
MRTTLETLASLALPVLALAVLAALFVVPLWYLARTLGVC